MKNENRQCQNCKNDFNIESDDFVFYDKIKVPPPTFCPECRMTRRFLWRNNRSLYKRECGLCSKTIISMYKDDGVPVYCIECFNGDDWNQFKYAKEIDWTMPIFNQIYELIRKQPRIYQYRLGTVVNSDYGNSVVNCKNAYLAYSVIDCEDVMYVEGIDRSRNTMDSFASYDLDQCSWNILSNKNYNSHFLLASHSCIDSYFLYDCTNCQNCCLSSNLRNKQYVFRNVKLSKEEYEKAVEELHLETYSGFEKAKSEFNILHQNAIHKYADIIASQNVTGDFILNSKDVYKSFDVSNGSEDIRYSARIIKSKDVFDCAYIMTGELVYESSASSSNSYKHIGCMLCFTSTNMEYSLYCRSCSYCFGCVGLKNAEYCIFNKQYTKDEYLELVFKLRASMIEHPYIDSKGRAYVYGDFYPYEFSPFGYNETVALDNYPKNRMEALEMGYPWKEPDNKNYTITINSLDIDDSISTITDDILNQTIGCINNGKQEYQCTTAFRIVPNELQFYRQKKLPLPRYCPNCRHYQRLGYRNPMKLYYRTCSNNCGNTFESTYAPARPEKVYCESCYQKEVL
ncbi:hypothetical protein K8Q96_02940 [Candidatus Nomurabacteria bacterium]|nr:hypothetical protein [Candidatus Nomurabacteria bacterium]